MPPEPPSRVSVFPELHRAASAFPCMAGFGSLRFRATAVRRICGLVSVTQPLVTPEERMRLLAAGAARAASQGIDPLPVVRLFTPDAHATWLLATIDPADGDTAWGLIDLGIGMPALGAVKLSGLAKIVGPCGQPVLRDCYFHPTRTLSEYARLAQRDGSIPD